MDRGPDTPDLESSANATRKVDRSILRTKIIDLTPASTVSFEEPAPAEGNPEPDNAEEFDSAEQILELLPGGPGLSETAPVATVPVGETSNDGLPKMPSELQPPSDEAPPLDDYFRSK